MVPEDLEKFLAEHREIETTSVKEQPILSEKPTTDPTDSREDAAKQWTAANTTGTDRRGKGRAIPGA
jgi:hypothetical protein